MSEREDDDMCPECGFNWSQITDLVSEFVEDLKGDKNWYQLKKKWEEKKNENVL